MKVNWKIQLGIILIIASLLLYLLGYLIFVDPGAELFYFIEGLAFLPLEVLLVTLIIDNLLTRQEKRLRLEKMSMVIETFFSEVGSELLRMFLRFDRSAIEIRGKLDLTQDWKDEQYFEVKQSLRSHAYDISIESGSLEDLRRFLVKEREFLLRLLENPNLLEHESFTELLRATFHLIEELISRKDLRALSKADQDHIANDLKRAYALLIAQWIDYMLHLKRDYPYLYSLAVRTNPFNLNSSAEIK